MSKHSPEAARGPDVANGTQAASLPKDVPYALKREVHPESDLVERSGQAIAALLKQASDAANADCEHAREHAHKISIQMRAAEDRIKELEVDLRRCQDRALRAEERAQRAESWLVQIYKDIENRFFDSKSAPSQELQRVGERQANPSHLACRY